ncbi:hypothetical protein KXW60_002962 [Aspergillus fumigatus]|nr:hypothetical protein KXV47_008192 [Aspergillus fumigatus]KAH3007376.1 hypothetical protein KXW60_002962 [Aspergillus fumigatus]KAH3270137.1 hypothetical protein KXW55_002881 [Aspergillus fumigatus]KEY82391.1 hypothetical protein BA78_8530 [Aspergillus fumigatus]
MSLRPITTTLRTSVRFRPLPLLRAYHNPELHSNKGEKFYIPAQYPDNFESPSLIKTKDSSGHKRWEEVDSTVSEASVKADRGDVQFEVKQKEIKTKQKVQPDLEAEPTVHDM